MDMRRSSQGFHIDYFHKKKKEEKEQEKKKNIIPHSITFISLISSNF